LLHYLRRCPPPGMGSSGRAAGMVLPSRSPGLPLISTRPLDGQFLAEHLLIAHTYREVVLNQFPAVPFLVKDGRHTTADFRIVRQPELRAVRNPADGTFTVGLQVTSHDWYPTSQFVYLGLAHANTG